MEVLGEGTYGKVIRGHMKCVDMNLNKQYKKLKDNYQLMKIRDEITDKEVIKVLGKLKLIDIDQVYFIYEYLTDNMNCKLMNGSYGYIMADGGINLKDYFKKSDNITVDNIITVLIKVVKLVKLLHSHGIIHRDIKLENVVIDEDTNNVCLIDFDLSFTIDSEYKHIDSDVYLYFPPFINCYDNNTDSFMKKFRKYKLLNEDYYVKLYEDHSLKTITDNLFKIDVFAIGISFLDFLYDNREKLEKDKRFNSFYELFLNMTNVNPNQQFDLAQTIAVIDIIITAEVRVVD
jgi:serine/threonine protein kinase